MKVSDTAISETDARTGSGEIANGNNQIVTVRKGIRDITIDCNLVRQRIRAGEHVADIAAEIGIRAKQLRHVLERSGGKPREAIRHEAANAMEAATQRDTETVDRVRDQVAQLLETVNTQQATGKTVNNRTYYTPARAKLDTIGIDRIFELSVAGLDTDEIAETCGVSVAALYDWFEAAGHGETIARARRARADRMVHQTIKYALDESVDTNRAKLICDAFRWVAGKWDRARYGDKVDVTNTVTVQRLTDEQLAEKALQIQQRLGWTDGAA